MARLELDQAYPAISFRPRSRNWLARLMHWPAECTHLENGHAWMATFIPDTLYLRGEPCWSQSWPLTVGVWSHLSPMARSSRNIFLWGATISRQQACGRKLRQP